MVSKCRSGSIEDGGIGAPGFWRKMPVQPRGCGIEPAVRVICGAPAPTQAEIAANPRALELLRFALSEEYLALRRDAEAGAR